MGYNSTLGLVHGAHREPHGHPQPKAHSTPGVLLQVRELCPIYDPNPDTGLWLAEPAMLWKGGLEDQGLVEEL